MIRLALSAYAIAFLPVQCHWIREQQHSSWLCVCVCLDCQLVNYIAVELKILKLDEAKSTKVGASVGQLLSPFKPNPVAMLRFPPLPSQVQFAGDLAIIPAWHVHWAGKLARLVGMQGAEQKKHRGT